MIYPRCNPQGIHKKRSSEVQSALLRRHLLELTQSFIIPLVSWRSWLGANDSFPGMRGLEGCGWGCCLHSWLLQEPWQAIVPCPLEQYLLPS